MLSRALLAAAAVVAFAATPTASAKTTWLCRPDNANDPCHRSLVATVLNPDGSVGAMEAPDVRTPPKVDCFYVYPTVSEEPKAQADFKMTPAVKAVAFFQAAR